MALLLQAWLVLTIALSATLAVVVGAQTLSRLVRRSAPAAQPQIAPAAAQPPLVVHVPAPRRPQATDLLPTR